MLADKLDQIRDDLVELRSLQRGARATSALVALHRLEVELDGELRALLDAEAEASVVGPAPGGPLGVVLRDTRRLRRAAEMKGSMVAATRLLEREQSLLKDIAAVQLADAERSRLAQDDRAVVARFGVALADMPEALVRALLTECETRLAG